MSDSIRSLRAGLGLALLGALVAASVLPLVAAAGRLPEPLATHWSLSGAPDGSMPLAVFALGSAVATAVPAAVAWAVCRRRDALPGEIAPGLGVATFAAAVPALLSLAVVSANLGAATWHEASPIASGALASLAGAAALAAGAARLARRLETRAVPAPAAPSAGVAAGERAVWMSHARARWATPLAALFAASAVAAALLSRVWIAVPLALVALSPVPFASLRVRADRRGVELRYGPLGWPRSRIALEEIRSAGSFDLAPMRWGGWGYRGSRRIFRRAAVVLRAGPALRLDLADGSLLVVTVDDPASGAGLLNDLVARAAGG